MIKKGDIENLYSMIIQQMQHYNIKAGPTTTIKVSLNNRESKQFSSWATFNLHSWHDRDITSEIFLKIEFLLLLPETATPQRCIINITLDSKLPVHKENFDDNDFHVPIWILLRTPVVSASIDFVDYLVAKIFMQIVEDWIKNIEEIKANKALEKLLALSFDWDFIFGRIGLLGLVGFIATYVFLRHNMLKTIPELVYLVCAGIVLYVFITILTNFIGTRFYRSINKSILSSMIILTAGDDAESKNALDSARKSYSRIFLYAFGAISSLFLNILASYIYSMLSGS